ncbi:MAG: type II toxin-antitoxin system PemK/MazF family toxin [Caldilineae bacterium]|nr:type II toxin-antitoxin system PemK/MazF family toxin [Caldilineae bacterium]
MTSFRQGDIVLVPFPFTDEDTTKKRPAVVLSGAWFNNSSEEIILGYVTSNVPPVLDQDMVIIKGSEVKSAGLVKVSVAKAGKIFTIKQDRIIKKMGKLSRATSLKVLTEVRRTMDNNFNPKD